VKAIRPWLEEQPCLVLRCPSTPLVVPIQETFSRLRF
jgi:hypothetical protein